MLFITVGSRSFQFNRLLKAVDDAVAEGKIKDEIFAQIGTSEYRPKNYKTVEFLDHDQFNNKLSACDIVISHSGTGAVVNAVKRGKKVIAVPRLKQFGEVVDDHQIQLTREFEKMGIITACYECEQIAEAVHKAKESDAFEYHSNTDIIIDSIENFINRLKR